MARIIPGLLIAGFWLLLLLLGSYSLFCLVVLPIVFVAAQEYQRMVDSRSLSLAESYALSLLLSLPLLAVCLQPESQVLLGALLASFLLLTCYCLHRYRQLSDCFSLYSRLLFGILYIGGLGGHFVLLRAMPEGAEWLIIASAVTGLSDTGAYFVGRAMGKRKLCPNVSPNKTVEGAVGGVIAGSVGAVLFALLLGVTFSWPMLLLSALLLTLAGIVGDLTESIIKRATGTKDSGRLLAGHGGVLDRVDSLLFAAPLLYYLLHLSFLW